VGGGYSIKSYTGRLGLEAQTLPLINTNFYSNSTPFHILRAKMHLFLIPQEQAKTVEYPMVAVFLSGLSVALGESPETLSSHVLCAAD